MGNCISGDHSKAEYQTELPLDRVEERDYDPNEVHPSNNTTATNTPFFRTPDHTMAMKSDLEKSFLIQKSLSKDDQKFSISSTTSSPSKEELLFNPRLVPLLEFFSHLYMRKKDLFKKVISIHGEDLVNVFMKVGQVEEKIERPSIQVLQRSRSLGDNQDSKNEWIKVKTFDPVKGQPPSAQGGNNNGGSKPSK